MKQILLLHHPKLPRSLALAQEWAAQFERLGTRALLISAWAEGEIAHEAQKAELAITLGGDGTILRAAR